MKRLLSSGLVLLALGGAAWAQQPAPPAQCMEENARTMAAVNRLNNCATENVVLQGRVEKLNQDLKQAQGQPKPADPAPAPESPPPPPQP